MKGDKGSGGQNRQNLLEWRLGPRQLWKAGASFWKEGSLGVPRLNPERAPHGRPSGPVYSTAPEGMVTALNAGTC